MDEKEIRKLIAEVKEINKERPEVDISGLSQFQEIEDNIRAETDAINEQTDVIQTQNEKNSKLNLLQIGVDLLDRRKGDKKAEGNWQRQRKHNKGAKDAREIMLEQNKIIIERLNSLDGAIQAGNAQAAKVNEGIAKSQEQVVKATEKTNEQIPTRQQSRRLTTKDVDKDEIGRQDDFKSKVMQAVTPELRNKEEASVRVDTDETLRVGGKKLTRVDNRFRDSYFEQERLREFEEKMAGPGEPVRSDTPEYEARFMDEEGKVSRENANAMGVLADDIRASQGLQGSTRGRPQARASKGAAELVKNIGANSVAVQQAIDNNSEAQGSLAELTAAFEKMSTIDELDKKGQVKQATVIQEKIAALEKVGGADLAKNLGLDQVKKETRGGFFSNIGQGVKTGFFGINAGTKMFSKEGLKDAFTMDRVFGKAGTGGLSNISALQGTRQFALKADRDFEGKEQTKATRGVVGDEGLGLLGGASGEEKSKKEQWRDKWIPGEGEMTTKTGVVQDVQQAGEDLEAAGTKGEEPQSKREKLVAKRTGQATETIPQKQLETLEEIRDILQRVADEGGFGGGGDGGGGGGFFGSWGGDKDGKNKDKKGKNNKKPKGRFARFAQGAKGLMSGGVGQTVAKFGGAAVGVGMGAYTAYQGFSSAEEMADAGELTAEEEQAAKGEAIGEGAGGAAGAAALGFKGAAIGMALGGPVGAAVGGIIGGAVGWFGGSWLGGKVGEAVADTIPVNASLLAESNEQAENAMKQLEEKDSELASKIKQEANQLEQEMLAEKDNWSDNDKAAIKNAAIVKTLQNYQGQINALGISREALPEALVEDKQIAEAQQTEPEIKTETQTAKAEYTFSQADLDVETSNEYSKRVQERTNELTKAKMEAGDPRSSSHIMRRQRRVAEREIQAEMLKEGKIGPDAINGKATINGKEATIGESLDAQVDMAAAQIEGVPVPTADAVGNMSRLGAEADQMANAPVVVNNQSSTPIPMPKDDKLLGVMSEVQIREALSTLARAHDRRFLT